MTPEQKAKLFNDLIYDDYKQLTYAQAFKIAGDKLVNVMFFENDKYAMRNDIASLLAHDCKPIGIGVNCSVLWGMKNETLVK